MNTAPVLLLSSRPKGRPPSALRVGGLFLRRIAKLEEGRLQDQRPADVRVEMNDVAINVDRRRNTKRAGSSGERAPKEGVRFDY